MCVRCRGPAPAKSSTESPSVPLTPARRSLNVVAFTGSLRKASCNAGVLRYAASVAGKSDVTITIISADLPLYNTDLEAATPAAVLAFRDAVKAADAVILGVEELNWSFSAGMKNALDWGSRTLGGSGNVWDGKVIGLVGAGGMKGGTRAQLQLRQVRVTFHGYRRGSLRMRAVVV